MHWGVTGVAPSWQLTALRIVLEAAARGQGGGGGFLGGGGSGSIVLNKVWPCKTRC